MTKKDEKDAIVIDSADLEDMAERIKTADAQLKIHIEAKNKKINEVEQIEIQIHMLNGFKQAYLEMYSKYNGGVAYNPVRHIEANPEPQPSPTEG